MAVRVECHIMGVLCKPPGTGRASARRAMDLSETFLLGDGASRSAATVRKRYLMTLTT